MRPAALVLAAFAIFAAASETVRAEPNPLASEAWRTDFSIHSVDLSEIRSGGPSRDGIPSIDEPRFIAVGDASGMSAREPVVALVIEGDARAYPLAVLVWHEIVNDTVAGKPVTVTYCPLCNSAIVFDARAGGRRLDFGTTGRLRNSDLVMYDRQTESWWQQFTGEAIIGELTGTRLGMLPSGMVSWQDFASRHPGGKVLVPSDPSVRSYGRNPYAYYDTADRPFLYSGELPEGIAAMARVVVIRDGATPQIIALDKVRNAGRVVRDGLVITWKEGMASALDDPVVARGRDTGSVSVVRSSDGTAVVHDVTFAFVAHAFHPETEIEAGDN